MDRVRDNVAALQQTLVGAGEQVVSLKSTLAAEWQALHASGNGSVTSPTDWVVDRVSQKLMFDLLEPARALCDRTLHLVPHTRDALEVAPVQRQPWADADAVAGGGDTDHELDESGGGSLSIPGKRCCPDDELNEAGARIEDNTRVVKAAVATTAAASSSATPSSPPQEAAPAELRHPVFIAAAGGAGARQHSQV